MVIYKTKDLKGKSLVGQAKLDFLETKYKEKQKIKTYNFERFLKSGTVTNDEDTIDNSLKKRNKFDLRDINSNLESLDEIDPIQKNTSDLNYKFDDEDPITSFNSNNNN